MTSDFSTSVSQVHSTILTTNQTANAVSDENVHIVVYIYVHEPQLPWLRTLIYHIGLDVKKESHPARMYVYVYILHTVDREIFV